MLMSYVRDTHVKIKGCLSQQVIRILTFKILASATHIDIYCTRWDQLQLAVCHLHDFRVKQNGQNLKAYILL